MRIASSLVSLGLAVSLALPAVAQQQVAEPAAKLYRVDGGIFELKEGKVIDLTDRKILLVVRPNQDPKAVEQHRSIYISIGGNWNINPQVGNRIDLKGNSSYRELLKDKDHCFLDLIDVVVPKGAPITATFRFDCK